MKFFLFLLFTFQSLFASTPFSSDSALSYLRTISVTIGARPMGSPNEQRAMEYAIAKFQEFGLHEAYIMQLETAQSDISRNSINTNTGVAVGILHGKTDRIIVIGGHTDSISPDVPGANDDGSGSAAVIELARVLSKEQHQSTIVFCLFGGEEYGLIGSKYFVNHFLQIDSVALMMELDMASGSDVLIPSIDSKSGSTPIWLVQAAYEEFGKLGYSGLCYPTHFSTSMSMMPDGGISSDHASFLQRNIPAIAFSSDLNDPFHTPQDDFNHFKSSGLKRSGDLVYALINRFDKSLPEEKKDGYYLLQIGNRALFFPLWLLSTFIITSILLSVYALVTVRKRRIELDKNQKTKLPALKLFLLALLIQTFVWLSENLVGLIKGVRFPWFAHPNGYFILGFLAALLGIAFSLKLSPRINLSKDPYRWFLRTVIFLLVLIALLSLTNVKITLYPSLALFFLSLAMLVNRPWLKSIFWIISPYFMFRLIFSEGFIFMGRDMAFHATQPLWMYAILHLFYIIFFAFWSFPFLLGFAAVYFDSKVDLFWLKRWQTYIGTIIITAIFLICTIILAFIPSFSDVWRQNIGIDQTVDLNTGKVKILLKSNDYLRNLNIHFPEIDTNISTWNREMILREFSLEHAPWVQVERTVVTTTDSSTSFDILINTHFKYRPLQFTLSYSAGKNNIYDVSGLSVTKITNHNVSMRWVSFPDTSMLIPIHFRVAKTDSITETIEAKFIEMIEPIRIEKEFANIISRTTFQKTEIIKH